jgi:hypothetical protein
MKRLIPFLLGTTLYVTPTPDGGFTVTDPFNPEALTHVTPRGDGGYTAIQPFNPQGLKQIEPNGNGYIIISPFGETKP